jgi:hypothetical protein
LIYLLYSLIKAFSKLLKKGNNTKKYKKYNGVIIIDNSIKGVSTTSCPTQPNIIQSDTKNQNNNKWNGLKNELRTLELSKTGKNNKITIAKTIKTTPPNLSGMVLKIA